MFVQSKIYALAFSKPMKWDFPRFFDWRLEGGQLKRSISIEEIQTSKMPDYDGQPGFSRATRNESASCGVTVSWCPSMINQGKKMSLPTCHDLSRNVVVLDPAWWFRICERTTMDVANKPSVTLKRKLGRLRPQKSVANWRPKMGTLPLKHGHLLSLNEH